MRKDLILSPPDTFRIHRHDNALAAEFLRRAPNKIRVLHRRRIDRHLVSASQQKFADILKRPNAAANSKRHEAFFSRSTNNIKKRISFLIAGGDIKKAKLVRAFTVIDLGLLNRITGINQIKEVDALDNPAILNIKARDHTRCQHQTASAAGAARRETASARSIRPS